MLTIDQTRNSDSGNITARFGFSHFPKREIDFREKSIRIIFSQNQMVSSDFPNYYSVYIVYNSNVKFNSLLTLEYPEFFFFFFSTSSQNFLKIRRSLYSVESSKYRQNGEMKRSRKSSYRGLKIVSKRRRKKSTEISSRS